MENLESVMRKYKLSEVEHNRIENNIKTIMLYNKFPVQHPKAIIDIAPPASGKTGLNGYGVQQFTDNNVVVINSDELKPFHPKVEEIAKLYPEYFTKVTDQESNTWTNSLFEETLNNGYNVIFEGTGKNTRILETIKAKMGNYDVTVRGMAVNEQKCLISLLERFILQIKSKGWGRLVTLDHFYETYHAMPNTIDAIEKSGTVKAVEIFKRGSIPSTPIKIYDSIDATRRFPRAKYAVLSGREEDGKTLNSPETEKLINFLESEIKTDEERNIFEQILKLHNNKEKEKDR